MQDMDLPIKLQIKSPRQTLVDCQVENVTLPGICGLFEVLKDHAPLITALEPGTIRYKGPRGEKTLEVRSGFVMVLQNEVNVCVEQ